MWRCADARQRHGIRYDATMVLRLYDDICCEDFGGELRFESDSTETKISRFGYILG